MYLTSGKKLKAVHLGYVFQVNDGAFMALELKQTPMNTGPPLQEKPSFYKYGKS